MLNLPTLVHVELLECSREVLFPIHYVHVHNCSTNSSLLMLLNISLSPLICSPDTAEIPVEWSEEMLFILEHAHTLSVDFLELVHGSELLHH